MSMSAMVRVWEKSKHRSSRLLALLALADAANEEDIAWPKMTTIAKRCRATKRQAQKIVRPLELAGEIYTHFLTGRTWPNFYLVAVGLPETTIISRLVDYLQYPPELAAEIAERLLAAQGGEDIETWLEDIVKRQPALWGGQIRQNIVTGRKEKKASKTTPPNGEKRAKELTPRGEEIAIKGGVNDTHEPMNPKHEPQEGEGGEFFLISNADLAEIETGNKNTLAKVLISFFAFHSAISEPEWNSKEKAKAANRRWKMPLLKIAALCDNDLQRTQALILWALEKADTDGWGDRVRAPGSIEGTCEGVQAKLKRKHVRRAALREKTQHEAEQAGQRIDAQKADAQAAEQAAAQEPEELQEARVWWAGTLRQLKLQMTRSTFNDWLKGTQILSRENGTVTVAVTNEYIEDWLDNRLRPTIFRALQAASEEQATELIFQHVPE